MRLGKKQLREKLLRIRQSMPAEEVFDKSQTITDNFMRTIDWSAVHTVHIYRSVAVWKEVDTAILASRIWREHPEVVLELALLDKNAPLPKEVFDLIVIPVVGFDRQNHRLGLGGGWYDRFLAGQPGALKVGLCFTNGFIEGGLPRELHDIPLDVIVTEEDIIKTHDS